MSKFVVKRNIGNFHDYLSAWDEEWGTSCRSGYAYALTFKTLKEAQEAASKAQKICKGFDGQPSKISIFEAVEI